MRKSVNKSVKNKNGDKLFYVVCYAIIILLTLSVLYPVIFILSASFSSPAALARGSVFLWPVDFSLEGYKTLFMYKKVWIGYRNTIFYVIIGTSINVILTMICAYPMARKDLWGRSLLSFLFTISV